MQLEIPATYKPCEFIFLYGVASNNLLQIRYREGTHSLPIWGSAVDFPTTWLASAQIVGRRIPR